MSVAESLVEDVVREVSERMREPAYAQQAVAAFIAAQPNLAQYVGSMAPKLGGQAGVLELLFHAQLMAACFERALGRALPKVEPFTMNLAAEGDALERLSEREPALASYVVSNVDSASSRNYLAKVAVAMSIASVPRAPRGGVSGRGQ